MASVKSYGGGNILIFIFQLIFSVVSISSSAQTKQSYRNHEEIDVGGGMKVEILKCYGEGPTEECDCIYFKEKRQTGTRMKQNANRLKEEERAANLAKGITEPVAKSSSTARSVENRTDKAIPASIIPNPNAKPTPPGPTLEEAVKKADSVARASSQKMKEDLANAAHPDDSTEMDKVYIPNVTKTGETRLDASNLTGSADKIKRDTIVREIHKDTAISAIPAVVASQPIKEKAAESETAIVNGTAEIKSPAATISSASSDTIVEPKTKSTTNTPSLPVVTITNSNVDTADNWVKQYQKVNLVSSVKEESVSKTSLDEVNKEKTPDTLNISKAIIDKEKKDTQINTSNTTAASSDSMVANLALIKNNTSTSNVNLIGKSAEVNTKGEWEKATIIDKETEFLYKVHYLGRTSEHDEWVSVTQIRNIDTATFLENKPVAINTVKTLKVNNCSFEPPAPPVSNADRFSEKLAKRKIYESYIAANKGNTTKRTGITFLSMATESPYVNTVSVTAANVLEIKFAFAPAGAMIYPVKTQYKICEQEGGKTSSTTVSNYYGCFRNKTGAWTCALVE
ncbi:hypothetical protein [Segetibacter aerophilus]|uniref:Uncharacterized protein n=1 Tax=Segetibacter aerophilus TaxID=670293 RepID=A0A512BBC0_9BACT|nr:hypothetical protein [Segetibacter aerophilus]GEO09269.1 hypothetical protein SAE01_17650 [Segetibacter aerophilus]